MDQQLCDVCIYLHLDQRNNIVSSFLPNISSLLIGHRSAVEAMTHAAGPALVMVVGGKNIISFGVATALVPMSNSGRYKDLMVILASIFAGWMALAVPLYYLMPRYRQWRADKRSS